MRCNRFPVVLTIAAVTLLALPTSVGAAIVFTDNFESPDVGTSEPIHNGVPATTRIRDTAKWVGATQGYGATSNGLLDEAGGAFTDPVGEQAYGFRYTNSGVTTAEGVIGVLEAGTYTASVDVVRDDGFGAGTPYRMEFVAFDPGDNRTECRAARPGTILATAAGNAPTDGTWATATLNFTVITGDASLGKDIGIRFIGATTSAIIDNVSLDAPTGSGPSPDPASLTLGSRVLVSENNQNFNISVFDGKAGYDNTGTTVTNPPLVTGTFGDGTVEDYNFFYSPSETIVSYAKGGAGLISDATSAPGNINGNGEDWSNVWTTSDPGVDFNTTKDFTNGSVPRTFARSADITGSIDISGLESGSVYIPHGTFVNQWDLALTMSGPGQPDLVANDAQTSNGPGTNFGWITDFSFSNPGLSYDTITYTYFNADRDGSRARFMGVILDGVAPTAVPEPSTFVLAALGLLGLAWFGRRRRRLS